MPEIAYYKDKFVDVNEKVVPIQERAHQFGDGIYEVIRVCNGNFFYLNAHLERLQRSADAIQLQLPYSLFEVEKLCKEALEKSEMTEAEVYIQVSRGVFGRQHHFPEPSDAVFTMTVKAAREIPDEKRQNGIDVVTMEDDRWKNCYIKSLNLLPNVLAKQKAKDQGCEEAVYHENGFVKEGCSSNLFAVKEGILYTYPALNGILHGITRQIVMDLARRNDIQVKEEAFTLDFFHHADEVFMTSTSMDIIPVRQADGHHYPDERPVTAKLIAEFEKLK